MKLPPGLVSNLQDVLKKKGNPAPEENDDKSNNKKDDESAVQSSAPVDDFDPSKPVIFVTNSDGIDSPGLIFLIEALVSQGLYNVSVCAPQV